MLITPSTLIHPSAIIDPSAIIAPGVSVGPWTTIGPSVEIQSGTTIASHVVIKGPCKIGRNNQIYQFCSIGEDCQDKKYQGEETYLEIGDGNVFRESCTVHRGTVQDSAITRIGHRNLFMVNVHIAHDCIVGNDVIIANNSALAGHVMVGNRAILGGFCAVHQFCQIGASAMCGAGTVVLKDIPAYVLANGNPARPHGINSEGLKRLAYSAQLITQIRRAYKTVYRQNLTLDQALISLDLDIEPSAELQVLQQSLRLTTRGIIR